MVGSADSLDFMPDLSISDETNAIPIDCWQDVCLSKIWVPDSLLPNRKKPSNTRVTQGILHTLQKRDSVKCIQSFSVYSDTDVETEQEEIFQSDSDDSILDMDTDSFEKVESVGNQTPENISAMTSNNTSFRNISSTDKLKDTENNSTFNFYKNECYRNDDVKIDNLCKLKSFPSLNNLSIINNDECVKLADSFEKLMKNRLSQYKGNNTATKDSLKKENIIKQNIFESASSTFEDNRNLSKNDKSCISNKNEILTNDVKNIDSHNSLHDILDTTTEINMKDFTCNFTLKKDNSSNIQGGTTESNKKSKRDKKKKKALKSVTLDQFLEDYEEEDRQEAYCNDYLQKLLSGQYKENAVQIKSTAEFPNLTPEEIQFIHSEKSKTKMSQFSTKSFVEVLTGSDDINENLTVTNYNAISAFPETTNSIGKIVIENVPCEVCHEDIYTILCGYGEIKDFSLEPVGDFQKVTFEIDANCDVDWIIECLNGSEPFGASSKVLKCYKQ